MGTRKRTTAHDVVLIRGSQAIHYGPTDVVDYYARVRRVDGVPVIDALTLLAPQISAETVRSFSTRPILAWAATFDEEHWHSVDAKDAEAFERVGEAWPEPTPTTEHREPLTRPDGSDPDAFLRRVAAAYKEAIKTTNSPAVALAKEVGGKTPVVTVHRWIREARKAGYLPAARKGRAG